MTSLASCVSQNIVKMCLFNTRVFFVPNFLVSGENYQGSFSVFVDFILCIFERSCTFMMKLCTAELINHLGPVEFQFHFSYLFLFRYLRCLGVGVEEALVTRKILKTKKKRKVNVMTVYINNVGLLLIMLET